MPTLARPALRRFQLAIGLLAAAVVLASPAEAGRRDRRAKKADGERQRLQDPAHEAYRFYQFGNQFFQQGLYGQAMENLRRALSVQPVYPEANYMLALVYLQLSDPHAAMQEAHEALRHNPFFTECHNVLGLAHARLGQHDAALREFQAVLSDLNYPTPEVAHFNIGRVFWEQQSCGDALIHFRRALEVNPQFGRAWYLLGDCQEQTGQLAQAKGSYRQAIDLMGDDAIGPMYRLGLVCFHEGDHPCAREWFDRVRTIAPASEMAAGAREHIRTMDFR